MRPLRFLDIIVAVLLCVLVPDRSASAAPPLNLDSFRVKPVISEKRVTATRTQEVAGDQLYEPGTIVIETSKHRLSYMLAGGEAIRYPIGVGREGFKWKGTTTVDRKEENPDWYPPEQMRRRQPSLPGFMAGGPGNPLGERALYLKGTLYRIHGTIEPDSIGRDLSSGCIRMLNVHVKDLYERVKIGTKVVVLP